MDLFFSELSGFPISAVDLFAVEFIGACGGEFLVDDLQVLGAWNTEPE